MKIVLNKAQRVFIFQCFLLLLDMKIENLSYYLPKCVCMDTCIAFKLMEDSLVASMISSSNIK